MSRRSWLSAALIAMLIVGGALPAIASNAPGDRSLWVWDAPSAPIVDFAVADGVTDLYLYTPPGFSTDATFSTFLTDAHAAGLAVHAMGGDPSWAADSARWLAWVDEVVAHDGFDGVVFDVEPYLHSTWSTKQNRLIRTYLRGLDQAVHRAGDLPVLAAVPFWFDEIEYRRQPLVERVVSATDGIVVMAYRDHAEGVDGIIDLAATEAALAASLGRTFVIGVETGPVGLDKVSFAEEGSLAMETELAVVTAAFAATPGYAGVAIHHYASYSTMAP